MELDGRQYPEIDYAVYRLPQDLYQSNPYEAGAASLGYYNHHLTVTRRRQFSSHEVCLYYDNDLLPVPWVWEILPCLRTDPHPELSVPHDGRASSSMCLHVHKHTIIDDPYHQQGIDLNNQLRH